MAEFVTQCYETYPQYGEETLENKIKTFTVGIEDYDLPEIGYAFRHWLKENEKMPLPSQIGYIAKSRKRHVAEMQEAAPVRATPAKSGTVPWFGLTWKQIEEQGIIPQIERHLVELTAQRGREHAEGYLRFLKNGPINHEPRAKT